jgi:RING-type zinc-finger
MLCCVGDAIVVVLIDLQTVLTFLCVINFASVNAESMAGAAIAAADELSQNLRDQFLQCKVCLDGLKEPKTLPCLHTFCAECIQSYITQNSHSHDGRSSLFSCPICRRPIFVPKEGANGFPDSFFVRSLNDVLVHSTTKSSKVECVICKFKDGRVEAKVNDYFLPDRVHVQYSLVREGLYVNTLILTY